MISAATVYDSCLSLIKKDKRSRAFNISEYNAISALVNMELYNNFISKYENGMSVTDALLRIKTRNTSLTLTAGQAWLPSGADRLAGRPWMAHPWGAITATAEVEVKGYPDTKVKITSPGHGLKEGSVITATGLSTHTITAKPIFYIDKNNFWVNVDYTAADTLTSAAWTVADASYKEIDMVTEDELAVRWADHLSKPSTQNPVAVLDVADISSYIGIWVDGGYDTSLAIFGVWIGDYTDVADYRVFISFSESHGLETGDVIYIYGGRDSGTGDLNTGYNGLHRIIKTSDTALWLPDVRSLDGPDFALYTISGNKRINVYPTTIPTIYLNYFSYPATPFLDYYVDENYAINYLSYGQIDVDIATGEEYSDGTAGPVTVDSLTQDWEWDMDLLPQIVYMILLKAGINLENMNVTQIAAQLQTKEESQV